MAAKKIARRQEATSKGAYETFGALWADVLRCSLFLGKRALEEAIAGSRLRSMGKGLQRLVVVALVLGACNRDQGRSHLALEDVNHDGKIVLLAFGDSITRGVGDGPQPGDTPPGTGGYPPRLQQLLGVTVVNDGNSGERTTEGLPRLRRDVTEIRPDYTILLEGTNDILGGDDSNRAIDNLRAMIHAVRTAGAVPILGTITPFCCETEKLRPRSKTLAFDDEVRRLAADRGVTLIDFYSAFAGGHDAPYEASWGLIHIPEGVHPTAAGYDAMAAAIRRLFLPG
jgi:lysophospholipase L1-like esterase